ncbi:MAG: dTDP-4-dehydrorhamnose 3,5-epimerase [Dehalococcoidia bacterium]|nr:MAG: dTDP-4-dehydrorhamnose 3,5-epimerase [Dehalococcoidia bacterium]
MLPTVRPTALEGVVIVAPVPFRDERGFFVETYRRTFFHQLGLPAEFVQENHSRSRRGVLRGIHYQDLRQPMAKLVRCTRGRIFDVAVDLRVGSPTFGHWVGVVLDDETLQQLFVPVGFGHAFVVLSDEADVEYRCTGYYSPEAEGAIAWNDPDLGIEWPIQDPILSPRDRQAISLAKYLQRPAFYYSA